MRALYQTVRGRIPQSYEAIKLKIAGRQTSNLIMGQNKYQWRNRRIGRIEILLHRAVRETALNKNMVGLAVLHQNV